MTGVVVNKVPPDGGYGWVVTFAYALNNVVVLPLIAGFGLVFQEAFEETKLTATQATLIITLNHGIGMLLSFFGGPVLRRFGYRKVAVSGALLIAGGLMITSFASNFWLFIFSYSIINSMGIAAVMAAFSLAINSFFKDKRARAVGVGMSITGLGSIYMPLLISLLIYAYGWRYAVLILGAICLHSLVAACLLRPAKWYLKHPEISEETEPLNNGGNIELINGNLPSTPTRMTNGYAIRRIEELKQNGTMPAKSHSVKSLSNHSETNTRNAISHPDLSQNSPAEPLTESSRYKWWESQEINLGSSINIFLEKELKNKKYEIEPNDNEKPKNIFQRFVDFFDLTLLKDPIFVNILFGLSVASCVEANFTLLLPLILKDMFNYETADIAKLLAIIGFSDTLFRLVSPFIGEWCNKSPRVMYMVSLLTIIFIRSVMLFATSFTGMILVALAMGFTKGIRTVNMNIVIPAHVPLERLPFASGIQQFFNGIIIISMGSLLGRLRDSSGSYHTPIIVLNVITLLTVIAWSAEFLYFKYFQRADKEVNQEMEA